MSILRRTGSRCASLIAVGGAVLLAGCPAEPSAQSADPACVGAQALVAPEARYFGAPSMAAKQLSLTFDDGPGARTVELSAYLKSAGVRATFFVNGKEATPAVLQQLVDDGHLIANHTQTHASLTGRTTGKAPASPADIVGEVTQTDTLIAPYVPHGRFMFRAPYGDYDVHAFQALQASPMKKYVGHIEWDIGGVFDQARQTAADFACWNPGARTPPGGENDWLTSKQCGDLYIAEIRALGKGIVLLHDPHGDMGNQELDAGRGNTVDMVKYMLPILKADGFTFINVDEVPPIAAALPPRPPQDGGSDAQAPEAGARDAGEPALPVDAPVEGNERPCPR